MARVITSIWIGATVDLLILHGHNPEDIATWEDLVDRAPVQDVYYRPGYVRAYALTGHGRPVAVVVRSGSTEALFPLLIRKLDIDGQVVRDAATPYGYGGLLRLSGPERPEPEGTREIFGQLRDWARASGLVACTQRFHPLLDQDTSWVSQVPREWSRVFPRGETTAVDLKRWDDSRHQLLGMTKGRRYDLKRARSGLDLRISEGTNALDDLKIFRVLYRESMERARADEFFFFTDEYFYHLATELGDKFAVITALAGERPVASAIFLADSRFAHYHLAGSNDEGRRQGAATLLVMAASEWARQRGCLLLHLGGGLQPSDSLWEFKRGFGGQVFSYSYLSLIADPEQYQHLVQQPRVPWPYTAVRQTPASILLPAKNLARCRALRIGYFGDGPWAHQALDLLGKSELFEIAFIVARNDQPDPVLREYAEKLRVPFLVHPNVNSEEFLKCIAQYCCDLHVSMSFNQIMKPPILRSAPEGFINCHAGALPFYRGRNVLNWAIINGESRFGVTVHYIDPGIDTGNIILQRFSDITDQDDYSTVLHKAVELCAHSLIEALEMIYAGKVTIVSQETLHPTGSYFCPRRDGDEWIDWQWPSKRIYDFVRGIGLPSPGARTLNHGKAIAVLECELIKQAPVYIGIPGEVVGRGPHGNVVKTGDSTLLMTKIATVGQDGILENPRIPAFPISTRMGLDLRTRVETLEKRIAELNRTIQQIIRPMSAPIEKT
jgi:methionyl-tRNA formyltransferase